MTNETAIQRLLALRERYLRDGNAALVADAEARLAMLGAVFDRTAHAKREPEPTEVAAIEPQAERAVRKRAPKRSV